MRRSSSVRTARIVAAACATFALIDPIFAGISFDAASTCDIHHVSDVSNGLAPTGIKHVNPPPPSGSMPIPPSYQYGKTLSYTSGANTGTTSAAASVGAITTTNIGYTFASGTGISQSDPSGKVFTDWSELKISFDGTWDVTSGGYGPAYGYLAFTLGGIVGTGGAAEVDINLKWTDPDNGNATYRTNLAPAPISFGAGAISYPFSNALKLNSGLSFASGRHIRVSGTITFLARDPCGPTNIVPTDFEFSATPPVWKFVDPASGALDFSAAAQWQNQMGEPTATPNAIGARAQILGTTVPTAIRLSQANTLGTLDIDRPGVSFQNFGGNFTFDTLGGNAALLFRNTHDIATNTHSIGVPVLLNKSLDVVNDSLGPVVFTSAVNDGALGAAGVNKSGTGRVVFSNASNFSGGLSINQGPVVVVGSLNNTGTVAVNNGGMLSGNGNGASTGKVGIVTVNSGGSVRPGSTEADGSIGTLAMNSLTMSGGDLRMDVGGTSDRINVVNAATINSATITPVFQPTIALGNYTLLTAGSLQVNATPALAGVPTTSRLTFALDTVTVPNSILLSVGGANPKSIKWAGLLSQNWDLNTSQNWLDSSTLLGEHYYDLDSVSFDDTSPVTNVNLDQQVAPGALIFNNSINNYSIASSAGTGGLKGAMTLTKTGSAQLSLGLSNTYTGQTLVQGGTLQLATSTALPSTARLTLGSGTGSGALDLNGQHAAVASLASVGTGGGNTIYNNSAASAATLTFAGGSSTFGGTIVDGTSGASLGVALDVATGTLVLTGNSTYTGTTTIAEGATLQLGTGGTTGSIGSGAIVDNGVLAFNRSDPITIGNNLSGSGSLRFMGTGIVTLAGNNMLDGGVDLSGGGVLSAASDAILGSTVAPLHLDASTLITTAPINSARPIVLGTGGGTINTSGFGSHFDNVAGCGTLTKIGAGTAEFFFVSVEGLNVQSGVVQIVPGGAAANKFSRVDTLTVADGAVLDLADKDLIIDYANGGAPDPARGAQIGALLSSGFAGGLWNGPGINSSIASTAAVHPTALGYAEASAAGLANFDGQKTDGDMLLVKFTYAGDANLDGRVNALDFNALASNFGGSGKQWVQADFDYNGSVNTLDFNMIAINFNLAVPGPGLGALVPEPICLLLPTVGLLMRRSKRRR